MIDALNWTLALAPVLLLAVLFEWLDVFRLMDKRELLGLLLLGGLAALAAWPVSGQVLDNLPMGFTFYSRVVAPWIEEALKGAAILWLVWRNRVGFTLDAVICGFTIGAGFSVVENVFYLLRYPDLAAGVWLVRGFGTAVMHGGATAIFGIAGMTLEDHGGLPRGLGWATALTLAAAIHSVYNHFFLSPILSTALVLIALPPIIFAVFRRSEKALEQWLNVGFDADTEVLEMILSGNVSQSHVGTYLKSLKERFRGEVVVDMLCYLRMHLELSLRAKGLLMMREAGFPVALDTSDKASLDELEHLERSIGPTGKLAMAPFLRTTSRDIWQIYMMKDEAAHSVRS